MEEECCPRFDAKKWDGKVFTWKNKRFVKDSVWTVFYIPFPWGPKSFGAVIRGIDSKARAAGVKFPGWMGLSDHTSKWNMDVYVAVDKEVPGLQNTSMSGKFLSKVYEGPFQDTGKWCKDFEGFAKKKKLKIAKMFMWYTTCPKCAKKYGKNYVVIIARLK